MLSLHNNNFNNYCPNFFLSDLLYFTCFAKSFLHLIVFLKTNDYNAYAMKKVEKLKRNVNNFLFDHYVLKTILEYIASFLFSIFAAMIFAFGFCCFITPSEVNPLTLATGGASGVSQILTNLIHIIFNYTSENNSVYSIIYFLINTPLMIFAFFKISKKFAIFSLINVAVTSLAISFFTPYAKAILESEFLDSTLARALFASICTGLSSAIAFKGDVSCGGLDIITYYIGMKKSSTIGKYTFLINCFIISGFALTKLIENPNLWVNSIYTILYSLLYLFVCGLIIDYINSRNKKVQLQIITDNPRMSGILLAYFPHGATITHAEGAYTHGARDVIWMVVSSNEVNKAIKVTKKVDPHVFVSAIPLHQVYGNFYNKPVA